MAEIVISGTGLIKAKCQDRHFVDGVEYYYLYSRRVRKFYTLTKFIQKALWLGGVAVHDPIFGECTPDFNCCEKDIGRGTVIKLSSKITGG